MRPTQAREIVTAAINTDPEKVITLALTFSPRTASIVEAVRKVPGDAKGVAAAALKDALRGQDNAETERNLISFAETLAKAKGGL